MKLVFISMVTTPRESLATPACGLREACAITTSSKVIVTPPCVTSKVLRCSGLAV